MVEQEARPGRHDRTDVVDHLTAVGVTALDVVAVTHPHADHLGQFDRILDTWPVDAVWWSPAVHTTATFDRALATLITSGTAHAEPRAGDTTTVGSLLVEFVNPPAHADVRDLHDSGVALRITYGQVAFLLTGDAEAPTEQRMLAAHPHLLAADVYQVGHHGAHTSTTPAFLAAVAPQIAVYSAAAANPYAHPHDQVVRRLTHAGVAVYGTDTHGTVTVTTDGTTLTVTTERHAPPITPPPDPQKPDAVPAPNPPDRGCAPGQVDVNTADPADLQRIVHIGPQRARHLVALRPLTSLDQLTRVHGIADARLRDIRNQHLACVTRQQDDRRLRGAPRLRRSHRVDRGVVVEDGVMGRWWRCS